MILDNFEQFINSNFALFKCVFLTPKVPKMDPLILLGKLFPNFLLQNPLY